MVRILGFLLALAIIGYGIWPYYRVFQLDTALGESDPQSIAPFVELPAIQRHYKERIGSTLDGLVPRGNHDGERVIAWLAQNLRGLGDSALGQVITLEWVRNLLRDAAVRATNKRPAYFMAGIDFAFFESWDRFVIRLGRLDNGTQVVMTLEGADWRITDIAASGSH